MDFYFSRFVEGVNDSLIKAGYDNIFDVTGTIFPTISTQTKWHYAKSASHIHLHDGNNVYSFHMPEGSKDDEDFPLNKVTDVPMHEYDKDAINKGTAQIHRADPGSIYFTVQDGHNNPTYTFKHTSGSQWRAIPKVKHHTEKPININENDFINGVNDKLGENVFDNIIRGADSTGRAAMRGVMDIGDNPLASAGVGLLGGAAYDLGKRQFYNSDEENAQEEPLDRIKRYLIPAVAGGAGGALLQSAFPNYYSEYPVWRP